MHGPDGLFDDPWDAIVITVTTAISSVITSTVRPAGPVTRSPGPRCPGRPGKPGRPGNLGCQTIPAPGADDKGKGAYPFLSTPNISRTGGLAARPGSCRRVAGRGQ